MEDSIMAYIFSGFIGAVLATLVHLFLLDNVYYRTNPADIAKVNKCCESFNGSKEYMVGAKTLTVRCGNGEKITIKNTGNITQ